MFHLEDVLQLKDGEKVNVITRRHSATLLGPLFLALVLIVIPFFLLFPLFAWGLFGVVLFFSSVVIGIVVAIRSLLLWDADVLIVTTFRVVDVDQKGLLARTVSEVSLTSIQDVSWSRQGLFETIFRSGSVVVQTAGASTTIKATSVPKPEEIYELINDLRHTTSGGNQTPVVIERADRMKTICRMLESYPDDELARIETVLKARQRASVADAFLGGKDEAKGEADESRNAQDAKP